MTPPCSDKPTAWVDKDEFTCADYKYYDICAEYGTEIGTNSKTANQACCACGGGRNKLQQTISYDRSISTCGSHTHCDFHGGGRCLCPHGSFGAGCATRTPNVYLATHAFELEEPTTTTSEHRVLIPLLRTTSNVAPTAIRIVEVHLDTELLVTALAAAGDAVTRVANYELLPPFDNVTWTNSTHGFIVATIRLLPDDQYEKAEIIALRLQPHAIFHQDCTFIGPLDVTVTIHDGLPGAASGPALECHPFRSAAAAASNRSTSEAGVAAAAPPVASDRLERATAAWSCRCRTRVSSWAVAAAKGSSNT